MEQIVPVEEAPITMGEFPNVATEKVTSDKLDTSSEQDETSRERKQATLIIPVSETKSTSLFAEDLASSAVKFQPSVNELKTAQAAEMSSYPFLPNVENVLPNLPKLIPKPGAAYQQTSTTPNVPQDSSFSPPGFLPPPLKQPTTLPSSHHLRLAPLSSLSNPPSDILPGVLLPPLNLPSTQPSPYHLKLAPFSSLSNPLEIPSFSQPKFISNTLTVDIPPPSMPPLLKLPTAPPSFEIPVASSGPSISLVHQTPTQSAFANIPLLSSNVPQISASLINSPPILPISCTDSFPNMITVVAAASTSTDSYPMTLPGGSTEEYVVLSEDSEWDLSSGEFGAKDPNNAAKCREYRERSRAKKEQEVRDFQCELSRNMKLKSSYDKKTDTIRKLKAYYIKCLQNKKYKCVDAEKTKAVSSATSESLDPSIRPQVSSPEVMESEVRTDSSSAISHLTRTDSSSANSPIPKTDASIGPMVTIKSEEADIIMTELKSEFEVEDHQML
eukprot:GFUD01006692.1.p1 GENE.GFUD01006692.1~~GFUD01006692.1.p1  ORF type:complete len:500 (-),score=130.67 GFUD01006692.1:41-1540(-)